MLAIDRHGTVEVYRPSGALKAEFLDEARETIAVSLSSGRPTLIIDLDEVLLLDSAALEWFLDLDEKAAGRGGTIAFVGGSELIHEILRLTGVGNRLLLFKELSEAMRCCAQ